MLINSQRLSQHAPDRKVSIPDRVLELKRAVDTCLNP